MRAAIIDSREPEVRTLNVIAQEIDKDWKPVNYAARPYLDAMYSLDSINGMYFQDSARSVVIYFLANASTWRGPKAREIKAELKKLAGVK